MQKHVFIAAILERSFLTSRPQLQYQFSQIFATLTHVINTSLIRHDDVIYLEIWRHYADFMRSMTDDYDRLEMS